MAKAMEKNPQNIKEGENNNAIVWQAPSFEYYPKGVSWYWFSLIIAILLAAFALWQKNFLFVIFVVLAELTIFIWSRREPEIIEFKIDEKGIAVSGKIYYYEDLEKFCLRSSSDKNFDELVLKRKNYFNPYFKIFIDAEFSSSAKKLLGQKLPEEEYEDSLIEILLKWLRF